MKYIALLRGINVGGHKKVPMAVLRDILTKSGLENVQTYIQSGNVIFQQNHKEKQELAGLISDAILDEFGFEVPVILKTKAELKAVFDSCPFMELEKEQSYFMMLNKTPEAHLVEAVQAISYKNETFHIINNSIYFYASQGYGRTKFNSNFFERKLDVISTARNYKTMIKLLSLSE